MKIVATIITRNRESVIADAIRSANELVDSFVIVDMGCTDKTLEVARAASTKPVVIVQREWDDDFAGARNFAQQCAQAEGADWQVTLDTDERFVLPKGVEALRQYLATVTTPVLHGQASDRSYAKYRFFALHHINDKGVRCKADPGVWVGFTHEFYQTGMTVETVPYDLFHFGELTKDFTHYFAKLLRDVRLLNKCLEEGLPLPYRWHFYLGNTYYGFVKEWERWSIDPLRTSQHSVPRKEIADLAIKHYVTCATTSTHLDERAFSYHRAACAASIVGDNEQAVKLAEKGFVQYPIYGECAWMVGYSYYQLNDMVMAESWARVAALLSRTFYESLGLTDPPRDGFTDLNGCGDYPWDLWYWAALRRGRKSSELEVLTNWRDATRIQLKVTQIPVVGEMKSLHGLMLSNKRLVEFDASVPSPPVEIRPRLENPDPPMCQHYLYHCDKCGT